MPDVLWWSEDELQNVEMAEREREKQNQEMKIKKRDYTGYDDEEFAPGAAGMKRAVLSKYDEFLEGPKETVRFVTNVWAQHLLTTVRRDSVLAALRSVLAGSRRRSRMVR